MKSPNPQTPYQSIQQTVRFLLAVTLSSSVVLPALAQNPAPAAPAACVGGSHYSGASITAATAVFLGISGTIKDIRNTLCGPTGQTDHWVGVSTGTTEWVQTGSTDLGTAFSVQEAYKPGYQIHYQWTLVGKYKQIYTKDVPPASCAYKVEYNAGISKWQVTYDGTTKDVPDTGACAFKSAQWKSEPHHTDDHTSGLVSNHSVTSSCKFKTKADGWVDCPGNATYTWTANATTANSATKLATDNCDVWDPRDP